MPAKLLIVSDQLQTSQEVEFAKPRVTIGRKAGNDLQFNRAEISGNHAAFLQEGETYFIQDLGSTNGTFMNGGQLAANQKYPLTPQDVVVIAPYRITLVFTTDMTKTFSESPARMGGRKESGTMIDVSGRVKTGTAEHVAPAVEPKPPAPAPAAPAPVAAPAAAPARPAPEPPPAPKPAAPAAQPAAPKPEPKPAPPRPPAPSPAPAAASTEEDFDEDLDVEVPSSIGDYVWLAIGGLCFLAAIALILYLVFGF